MLSSLSRSLPLIQITKASCCRYNTMSSKQLIDSFGRKHRYLRISLTERCNLRCKYCMPEEGVKLSDKDNCFSLDELRRLSSIFVMACGVDKIRLTGGEPTIDSKFFPLLEHLNGLRDFGLKTIAMTTNGLTLSKSIESYKMSGLDAINISLDTLREERFKQLSRRKGWNRVYQGLLKTLEANFTKVKLNCVIMKGVNDDEIYDFAQLAWKYPLEVRFIEFMPFLGNKWDFSKMIPYKKILDRLTIKFPKLERVITESQSEVSKIYKEPTMLGSIGFISSMTDNFCGGCDRLRLTSDGHLKVCLFGKEETSLLDLMRAGATDREVVDAIDCALKRKWKEHPGALNLKKDTSRSMVKIGTRQLHSSNDNTFFSHLNERGEIKMVNVNCKTKVHRTAIARGEIVVGEEILEKISNQTMKKGDILSVAKIAGILGAKLTSQLIPLCHQVPLNHIEVEISRCDKSKSLIVTAKAEASYNTGVEMESLVAVSISLLTLYDMSKSVNKSMVISNGTVEYFLASFNLAYKFFSSDTSSFKLFLKKTIRAANGSESHN